MTSFIATNKWPKTDRARQFLLFATRLKELLHPAAQDIYRVHAVSSLGKISEIERCCGEILLGRYPKAALRPIILEANECLDSDIIIKRIVRTKRLPVEKTSFDEGRSVEALRSLARLWRNLLSEDYERVLREEILDAVNRPRLKKSY